MEQNTIPPAAFHFRNVLYGTLFEHPLKVKCFTIQNILYYKGKNVSDIKWCDKFELFEYLLKSTNKINKSL